MNLLEKNQIQGIGVTKTDGEGAFEYILEEITKNKSVQIVTINPEMVVNSKKNLYLKEIINEAELVLPDGIGIKIALKLKGIKQEQIRGVDFAYDLLRFAQKHDFRVALLGAKQEVLERVVEKIENELTGINIVYKRNGYFDNADEVVSEIIQSEPNVILTALGSPKQEFINKKIKDKLPKSVSIGIGGSFDVWAGLVEEAPEIWQKMGLEWLFRTIKQPERFKRIFPTLPLFLFRSIIDMNNNELGGE